MLNAKVQRVSLLIFVLLLSACSQPQPQVSKKVKKKEKIIMLTPPPIATTSFIATSSTVYKVNEPKQPINSIKSTLSYSQIPIQEETWEPLEAEDEIEKVSLVTKQLPTQQETWVPLKVEDEIEWNAKELLGRKYVWGATGPVNYDCSGFTRKIFADVGIHLPRVSRDQSKKGQLVSFYELKKGDLVFFATKKRHPHRVTHVGIYLGNGNFIHASSGAKKIVVFNFNQHQYYKKHFLWGRRVIQDKRYLASAI